MDIGSVTWSRDWQQRVRDRLRALGFESIRDYLGRFPGEAYTAVAKRLGEDVAAAQMCRLLIEEIGDQVQFRRLAMDCLAREISANLPAGWQRLSPPPLVEQLGPWKHLATLNERTLTEDETRDRIEFQTSGVYAYWASLLQQYDARSDAVASAVWQSLKSLNPPVGWLPTGPDDPLIVRAFELGWPA